MTSPPSVPAPAYPSNLPPGPPSGTPIWVTVVASLSCLGVGLSLSVLMRSRPTPTGPLKPCASAAVQEVAKPAANTLTLAAQGDNKSMEELSAIAADKRSIPQAIALSKGRASEKRIALDFLRETLEKGADSEGLKRLMQFAQDFDTARDALGIASSLTGARGNDLLYEIATTKTTPPELANLANGYLNTTEVRGKSAPALALVLDLRDATTCEQRQALLEKSVEVGDKRLVRYIVPLTKKSGCGPKKSDDCNPCLRDDNQKVIRDALAKTQGRKAPAF